MSHTAEKCERDRLGFINIHLIAIKKLEGGFFEDIKKFFENKLHSAKKI